MPIIKTPPGNLEPAYFEVTHLEVLLIPGGYTWRAHYKAWPSQDAARTPGGKPLYTGVDAPQGYTPAHDPIAGYEAAAVLSPSSDFFGGAVVDTAQPFTALEWARVTQWAQLKIRRDAELASGVSTPYGVFDSDATSILNLIGAATVAATQGSDWSDQWILKDRSTVVLNRSQLLEVGALMADFRSRVYRRGDELYRAIQQAETVDAVRAVTW